MLSTTLSASEIGKKYTLYPFRWLMQAFFTVSMIVSGFLMVGFSPISNTIAKIYDCSQIIVQLQTLLFLIAFIPGNFIVIWVLNKYGLRATVGDNYILLVLILNLIDYDRSGDDTGGGLAEAASLNNWEI
jgi:predicted MFS family arabinose efflux permease